MLEYVSEIRVAIESLLTICSLWWTIRTLVVMGLLRDRLLREERGVLDHLIALQRSIIKIKDSSRKVRDKIIPGQLHIMTQLNLQMERMENNLEKSKLPGKVSLIEAVKKYYTEQPDSRYFRSSEFVPEDESGR